MVKRYIDAHRKQNRNGFIHKEDVQSQPQEMCWVKP